MANLSRPVLLAALFLFPMASLSLQAQEKEAKPAEKKKTPEATPPAPKEESSVTDHT